MTTQTTKTKSFAQATKIAKNQKIYSAVADSLKLTDNGNIDLYSLVNGIGNNAELKKNVQQAGIYRQDVLAWQLVWYWNDGITTLESKCFDLILNTPLRNEQKKTLKTSLQRLVTMFSDKAYELLIDDKKGGTLAVSIEPVPVESAVDKKIAALVKAMIAENVNYQNVSAKLEMEHLKALEKPTTSTTKKVDVTLKTQTVEQLAKGMREEARMIINS